MKVLWFTNVPIKFNQESKGTGTWMNSLLNEVKNKIQLTVCYYGLVNDDFYSDNVSFIVLQRKKYHHLINTNFYNKRITNKYLEIIDKVKPDVIHIHGTENDFSNILRHKNRLPPIVISIQGNLTIYKHFYFRGTSILKCILTLNFKFLLYYLWFSNKSTNERIALSNLSNVFGRTDWDFRITRVLAPMSNYFRVGEILRDDFYINEWRYNKNGKIVIYTTTGDSVYKGLEVIFQSINILNGFGLEFEWRVAGISSDNSLVRLMKFESLYKNKSNLILLGPLNSNDIVNEMLNAHLYVSTSHIENSPNSLCEALLIGMPCVTSLAGGTSSLVTDKIDGLLIQNGDPWSLSGAIIDLLSDKNKLIELGKNARRRALIRHGKENVVNELLLGYRRIL